MCLHKYDSLQRKNSLPQSITTLPEEDLYMLPQSFETLTQLTSLDVDCFLSGFTLSPILKLPSLENLTLKIDTLSTEENETPLMQHMGSLTSLRVVGQLEVPGSLFQGCTNPPGQPQLFLEINLGDVKP
jgi:hypothetical protein